MQKKKGEMEKKKREYQQEVRTWRPSSGHIESLHVAAVANATIASSNPAPLTEVQLLSYLRIKTLFEGSDLEKKSGRKETMVLSRLGHCAKGSRIGLVPFVQKKEISRAEI